MLTLAQRTIPTRIQRQIAAVNGLRLDFDVCDFVVPRSLVEVPLDRPEQLLLEARDDGGLDVSLVLDDGLLNSERGLSLDGFCAVAEGVSHLVYVVVACEREAQITALELELQAEIDKFALLVLALRVPAARALQRLFTGFSWAADVDSEEQDRYREANRLAHAFCRDVLARLAVEAGVDALASELRRVYRTRGGRKRDYVAGRCF